MPTTSIGPLPAEQLEERRLLAAGHRRAATMSPCGGCRAPRRTPSRPPPSWRRSVRGRRRAAATARRSTRSVRRGRVPMPVAAVPPDGRSPVVAVGDRADGQPAVGRSARAHRPRRARRQSVRPAVRPRRPGAAAAEQPAAERAAVSPRATAGEPGPPRPAPALHHSAVNASSAGGSPGRGRGAAGRTPRRTWP